MTEATKTKLITPERAKHLDPARRGVALKHPPKPPAVEGEEAQLRVVTCPAGHANWIEYDPDSHDYYECQVCHCNFSL
jgi:hypothetical protein